MGGRLKGKNAVVTGAGRGLGRAMALALAAEGARLVINDPGLARDGSGQDIAPADEVVTEIKKAGGEAVANYDSVASWDSAERIIKTCIDSFGRIDILVNNAGFLRDRMVFNMSNEEWSGVIDVMLNGAFYCSRHASGLMRAQKHGRIISITSDAWRGTVGHCNYGAAKAGIVGLTRALARELGKYNITCNAIAPVAATRMTMDEDTKQGLKKRLEGGLLSQETYDSAMAMPKPEGITPMVVYLATDEAANINGSVFHSEAGRIAIYSEPVEIRAMHKDFNTYGLFTIDELVKMVPQTLLTSYINPAPPEKA